MWTILDLLDPLCCCKMTRKFFRRSSTFTWTFWSIMEFHKPNIETFDKKSLGKPCWTFSCKKKVEAIYPCIFGWISWSGMKICRSNIEDSTRKGLGEPVKTFGSFWLLKSSCLDNILYQSITHYHQPLQRPYGLKWNSIGPTKKSL